jgi:hypothetical protein
MMSDRLTRALITGAMSGTGAGTGTGAGIGAQDDYQL